jgi:WD40 repeat protein
VASLFLSHSSADREAVNRIADRLRTAGFQSLFLDYDPEQGIPVGRNWELELYAQLHIADAVVFVASEKSSGSKWCFAELAIARSQGKSIFPIRVSGTRAHPLLADLQWVDLVSQGELAFERVLTSLKLHGFGPEDSFDWDSRRPPYPGLSSFQSADAAVFFGRDDAINAVLERLRGRPRRGLARCVAIVGPSGSGKSSLVRAGIIPRLRRLEEEWVMIPPITPGDAPFGALARALAVALHNSADRRQEIEERIRHDSRQLVELARDLCAMAGGTQRSVLLVIDQAEELIIRASTEEQARFADVLKESLQPDTPLWALLTLRSEFLGAFALHPELSAFVVEPLVVGSLDRSRLSEVIEGPAQRAGTRFAPGLVQRMVEDTQAGDALPLLAYTLRQLYESREQDGLIATSNYEALGGVVGALRNRADQVAEVLSREGYPDIFLPTLLKLVTLDSRNEPVRRSVALHSLRDDEREVIDRFVEQRLLVTHGDVGNAVVEVAHETLLRVWPPLQHAIEASREDLRTRAELERLALDWDAAQRQDSYLLQGDRLKQARRWLEDSGDALELPLVAEFLESSRRRDQAELRRESKLLGQWVLDRLATDPERGILLALAALEEYASTPTAILALSTALQVSRVRGHFSAHDANVRSVAFSSDGTRIVTASGDGTARVWDPRSGNELLVLRGHNGGLGQAVFSPDGSRVLTASRDATARVWDASNGQPLMVLDHHESSVNAVAYAPDGTRIVTAGEDNDIRLWDAATGNLMDKSSGKGRGHFLSVEYSPLGGQVVTGRLFPPVEVFNVSRKGKLVTARLLEGHESGAIYHAGYSPDATQVVGVSHDGTILVWDTGSGRELLRLNQDDIVRFAAFSPLGSQIVTGAHDGIARVWDVSEGAEIFELAGHSSDVTWAAWSPDATQIATTSSDGTARLWDATATWGDILAVNHDAAVYSAAFSPNGREILTASEDRTARVWDAASGHERLVLSGHSGTVFSAAYSPDGTRVVTASEDEIVYVWDSTSGAKIFQYWNHNAPVNCAVFSPDGTWVASGSSGELAALHIWNATTGSQAFWKPLDGSVLSAAFSSDGARICLGSGTGNVQVWDVAAGRSILTLPHNTPVGFATFSPDDEHIVTVGDDGIVRIWDATSGQQVRRFTGQRTMIASVCYSPDGSRILTAAKDGTARVWDATEGEELLELWYEAPLGWAAYSPDGHRIVTAAGDGTARVWEDLSLPDLVARARGRAFRSLTESERQEFGLPPVVT